MRTYTSVLNSLYKKLAGDDGLKFFSDEKNKIIEFINSKEKSQTQKTTYSASFVLTGIENYRTEMQKYVKITNDNYAQKKTDPARLENREKLTEEKLKDIFQHYEKTVKINPSLQNYVNFLIVCFTSGVAGIYPRRNLDYISMKIRNFDKSTDNYIDKNYFVFNTFKTAKSQGPQKVEIPKEVLKVIKKFIKINDSDYLLFKNNKKPMASSDYTKTMNNIYGGKMGSDVLRSIALQSDKSIVEALKNLEEKTQAMGTSINSATKFYIKNDV